MSKQLGEHEEWVMPDWMEQYRDLVEFGCGGQTAEQLMNNHSATFFNNAILCELIGKCESNVVMLTKLKNEGILLPRKTKGETSK